MRWLLVVMWLVCSAGGARAAEPCHGTAETIVGYSSQRDQYLAEERSVDGALPVRYVIRRLTTDEVVDYVTCADAGACSKGDALGLKACSFRPVPRAVPDDLSLAVAGTDESVAEVRGAGKGGEVALLRVRRAGRLVLRGGARTASSLVVFLTDTVDDGVCGESTHERAIMVAEPAASIAPPEIDLTVAPDVGTDVRVSQPPSDASLQALTMAARTAAAAHLDGLAGCWAQQALAMIGAARQRRVPRKPVEPSIELESVRMIVVRSQVPPERHGRARQALSRP
ncbi:MAG TPA: hypothetical protein VHH90_09715 [Polyangia bacterium]|nr:hypothetical protein [Polyangia bacterium]